MIFLFLHISRYPGAGDQINSLQSSYLCSGRAEVSQQLSSRWSSLLHLVQEWTDNNRTNISFLFGLFLSCRQLFLCFERTWDVLLSISVWVYSTSMSIISRVTVISVRLWCLHCTAAWLWLDHKIKTCQYFLLQMHTRFLWCLWVPLGTLCWTVQWLWPVAVMLTQQLITPGTRRM